MAIARTAREAWIEAGLRALASGGPEAVRVESLARDLGVTKGGFYGYFADRDALIGEVLDAWESRCTAHAIDQSEREGGDALTRARRAAELTMSDELTSIDLVVREWSRRDAAVAERLRRVDNERMNYLRRQFAHAFPQPADLEARCLLAFSAAVASHLIAADHPDTTRHDVLLRASELLFADAAEPT